MKIGFQHLVLMAIFCMFFHPAHASDLTPNEKAVENMTRDLESLTPYSSMGATVKRRPDESCMGFEPFKFLACGPQTKIHLQLMPGSYGNLQQSTTQGGQLAQWMSTLSAMQGATDANTLDKLAKMADSVDGSSITIVIPLIDYGFSGSLFMICQ